MADTLNYKCPNCSAGLTFDSKSQKMKCEYCGSTYSLDELDKIAEQAEEVKEVKGDHWEGFEPEQWQSDEKSNMAVWSCPSCGAEILAEKTTGATVCPYCDNPMIMPEQFVDSYRPDYIIYAPAIWSSNGDALMTEDVVSQIRYRLLPLCSVVVARKKENDIILQDTKLLRMAEDNGMKVFLLDNANSHGLTNRFSSALAVYLNQGKKMEDALAMAQDFINVELTRESNLQGRSSELYNQFISQVNNFCRTYSDVHFYADQLNVSSRYLAQVTRRISGKTPKAIIDEYIVKEIERELSTTTHTMQEIANTFGFSSQAHLTKFFKKMRGLTPSEYRKK